MSGEAPRTSAWRTIALTWVGLMLLVGAWVMAAGVMNDDVPPMFDGIGATFAFALWSIILTAPVTVAIAALVWVWVWKRSLQR